MRAERPTGITVLSVYYLVWGALAVLINLLGSLFGFLAICFTPGAFVSSIGGLITGVLNILLAGALFSGKDFARNIVMVLAVIGIVANVVNGLSGGFGIGLVFNAAINAFVLFYMQQDSVKRYFASR